MTAIGIKPSWGKGGQDCAKIKALRIHSVFGLRFSVEIRCIINKLSAELVFTKTELGITPF
jgi:hypothetical protein